MSSSFPKMIASFLSDPFGACGESGLDEKHIASLDINKMTRTEQIEIKRELRATMSSLLKAAKDEDSWQTVQAKRKREKDDIYKNNPGFDPVFMKV